MRNRIRAAAVPVVMVTAIAGAAGYRAQGSGPGRRLDELSKERPAAATHFPIDGALAAATQAAAEARWIEGSNARQMELFLQAQRRTRLSRHKGLSPAKHPPVPVVGVGAAEAATRGRSSSASPRAIRMP